MPGLFFGHFWEGPISYQVIARKWRPLDFSQLIGQDHVIQTLTNALRNDSLHHAPLFTGPRGTGKTSTARILAKSVRCTKAKDFVPCNECSDCDDISQGRCIDVIEIDGASNNGVDAIRELRDTVAYRPTSGKFKVYIIDEVHMLSTSAFNALLKTLEEPPEHVIFVLATTEVHKIPQTVLSRCQRFDFRRIPTKVIADSLKNICDKEGVKSEADALWSVARQGDGSMRDSQSLLDQVITFSAGHITLETVTSSLGLTDRSLLKDTVSHLVKRDLDGMIALLERVYTSGNNPAIFARELLQSIRNLLIASLGSNPSEQLLDIPLSEVEHLKSLSKETTQQDIHLLFDMCLKGVNDIHFSEDPHTVLEMLLLRMVEAPNIMEVHQMAQAPVASTQKSAVHQAQAPNGPPPGPPAHHQHPQGPPTPYAAVQPIDTNPNSGQWQKLVAQVKKVNPLFGAKLDHCFMRDINDGKITIGLSQKMAFMLSQLNTPDVQRKLTNYMKSYWGKNLVPEFVIDRGEARQMTPDETVEHQKKNQENELLNKIESDPLIKETKKYFKTKVKAIKEKR